MFHPVIRYPESPLVLDFTAEGQGNLLGARYTIGRYDERRPGLYQSTQFTQSQRDLHVGIDLGAPAGTPLYAFDEGHIFDFKIHSASGDYGPTLISEHNFQGRRLFVLWGHLTASSLKDKSKGQKIERGEVLAWIGSENENGGWPPHVHIQLSWQEPKEADLPGVVPFSERESALNMYPDPRLILGPLY